MVRFLRYAAWVLVHALVLHSPAYSKTIVVAQDGSGDVVSIQPAVTMAAAGDTIRIRPGVYTDHEPYIVPGFNFDTYVAVKKDNLTFIGDDRDTVIIGPPVAAFVDDCPKGFIAWDPVTLRIENLTVRNVSDGTNFEGGGSIKNVRFLSCDTGVIVRALQPVDISRVQTRDCGNIGVLVASGSTQVTISSTTVVNSETGIDIAGTQWAQIEDCSVDTCVVGIQIEQLSQAEVTSCSVVNASAAAFNVTTGAYGNFRRCYAGAGARITFNVSTSETSISRSFLGLGRENTIVFAAPVSMNSPLSVTWSDIEVEHAKSVWFFDLGLKNNGPTPVVDLTNNYWGLQDSVSISEVIWDQHDNPLIDAKATFVPFQTQSTPTRNESFGGLKGRYGG